jgi:hypothetical protein
MHPNLEDFRSFQVTVIPELDRLDYRPQVFKLDTLLPWTVSYYPRTFFLILSHPKTTMSKNVTKTIRETTETVEENRRVSFPILVSSSCQIIGEI